MPVSILGIFFLFLPVWVSISVLSDTHWHMGGLMWHSHLWLSLIITTVLSSPPQSLSHEHNLIVSLPKTFLLQRLLLSPIQIILYWFGFEWIKLTCLYTCLKILNNLIYCINTCLDSLRSSWVVKIVMTFNKSNLKTHNQT